MLVCLEQTPRLTDRPAISYLCLSVTHECDGGDRSEGVNAKVRVRKWIVYPAVMNTAKVRTKAVKVNMVLDVHRNHKAY